jgi:hypothetical protein
MHEVGNETNIKKVEASSIDIYEDVIRSRLWFWSIFVQRNLGWMLQLSYNEGTHGLQ